MDSRTGVTVGIDLGTSTTLIAQGVGGAVQVLPLGDVDPWLPSVVGLDGDQVEVGSAALRLPPGSVLRSPKRYITEARSSTADRDRSKLPEPPEGLDPVDALAALLRSALDRAGAMGVDVASADVRVGCPAMWTGADRAVLADIARSCGLPIGVNDLIDEPVAVGAAWIEDRRRQGRDVGGRIVVVDAGGGTTDVAVLEVKETEDGEDRVVFSVLASDAVAIAGDHMDRAIAKRLRRTTKGYDKRKVSKAATRLLATDLKHDVAVAAMSGADGRAERLAKGLRFRLDAPGLSDAVSGNVERLAAFVMNVVRSARLRERGSLKPHEIRQMPWEQVAADIDYVVVAGGTGQLAPLLRAVEGLFDAEVDLVEEPQVAVVRGLASSVDYDRINMPRPPFDFFVRFQDEHGQWRKEVLYEAFTPLFDPLDLVRGGSTNFVAEPTFWRHMHVTANATARLFAAPPDRHEDTVTFEVWRTDGAQGGAWTREVHDYLEATFDSRDPRTAKFGFSLTLRPDGSVVLCGTELLIEEWPTIRGSHNRAARPVVNVIDVARTDPAPDGRIPTRGWLP